MKSAKQTVYILIGSAMILLSVILIIAKNANSNVGRFDGTSGGDYGREVFEGPISTLVFEAGACNVEVVSGETDYFILDYEGLKYGKLTHKLEDGELSVSYKQNDNWAAKMFIDSEIDEQKITLMVPEGTMLDSALFEFGAADISMEEIAAKKLYLTVGAGELKAERITATEQARFKVGAGSFSMEDAVLTNAELECGVGEMNVSGTFDGDTKADCGVGAMELAVFGEQEQYRGELNCGLGEIDFGTISIEGSGNKSYGTSSAERRMDIKCGIGEVDVRFYN